MTKCVNLSPKFICLRSLGKTIPVTEKQHNVFYKEADRFLYKDQYHSHCVYPYHYIGKCSRNCIGCSAHAKHTANIHTLLQIYCNSKQPRVDSKCSNVLLRQVLNLLAPLTKITIFLINKCALTEMLQVILVVILLAIWLIFSIVFLIAVSQEFMYDRKHMIRKQDHSKHNLEYHESHKKEYCK